MIDIKEAVTAAVTQFEQLYPDSGYRDIRLEEVELTDDDKHWVITLSYMRPQTETAEETQGPASELLKGLAKMGKHRRDYRTFRVDTDTGLVRSMKLAGSAVVKS
jgi:hypothetical protein